MTHTFLLIVVSIIIGNIEENYIDVYVPLIEKTNKIMMTINPQHLLFHQCLPKRLALKTPKCQFRFCMIVVATRENNWNATFNIIRRLHISVTCMRYCDQKYTLYNMFSVHGLVKREKDHALIRSIAYRTLPFRRLEGEKQ